MKIAIVGWGIEGKSVFKYFGSEHEYLIVSEHPIDEVKSWPPNVRIQYLDQDRPAGTTGNVEDLSYLKGIENCDKIVYTPSAYKNLQKRYNEDAEFWSKATTPIRIFFETAKTKRIIGVTGTKGKGTTSTLIYQMLVAAGQKAYLGGNIGRSVLEFANEVQSSDWAVLELSNFQLQSVSPYSPHIAVCLMITPEHLDYHRSMEEYINAKSNLFKHQKSDDIAIYFDPNEHSRQVAYTSPGIKIPYFQSPGAKVREDGMIVIGEKDTEIINKNEVKLLGEHNLQNICAAITAVWTGLNTVDNHEKIKAIREVLTTLSGLENRLELVREVDGVKFYNDSYAAAPGAAIAAIESVPGNKVVIIGGYDRFLPLEHFCKDITKHSRDLRKILLIGQSAQRVSKELTRAGFANFEITDAKDVTEIVNTAKTFAKDGDSIVLSPGFPSFDMFKNFDERGQRFREAVQKL